MKTYKCILLIITLIAFGFISCSDDDDQGTTPEDILGEWILEDVSIGILDVTDPDLKDAVEGVYEAFFEDLYPGDVCKFNKHGTGVFFGDNINYSAKDNVLLIADNEGMQMCFSYIISGDQLILTLDMRKLIIDIMSADLTTGQLNYLKQTLKKFTVNITCVK